MADRLDGLVALITGGGRGIGRAIALRLASEGADVVVADINQQLAESVAAEVEALGRRALPLRADVSQAAACSEMAERAYGGFGRVDVAFCNAGIAESKSLFEIEQEEWDRIFAVNTRGVFFTLQAVARLMLHQDRPRPGSPRGKIVTTASIAGRYGGRPMLVHYGASKAAVISITQSAALALAPNITVNAMCPGVVDTEMWKVIDRGWTTSQGLPAGEAWKRRVEPIPMGRAETPEDVAALASFLASPDSDYLTGQAINIDGGLVMS